MNNKVIDTLSEYGLDKVSCFERPAVNRKSGCYTSINSSTREVSSYNSGNLKQVCKKTLPFK